MKWRLWRRREQHPPRSRADEALEQSRQQRDQARQQSHRFEEFAAKVRRMREENHLAEAFDHAFRNGDWH